MSICLISPRGTPILPHLHPRVHSLSLPHVSHCRLSPLSQPSGAWHLRSETSLPSLLRGFRTAPASWHSCPNRSWRGRVFRTEASSEENSEGVSENGEKDNNGVKENKGKRGFFPNFNVNSNFKFNSDSKGKSAILDGRSEASYYPPEFEYMKESENVDWNPILWFLGGVTFIWIIRDLLVLEIFQILGFCQVAFTVGSQVAVQLFRLFAKWILSFAPGPAVAVAVARFADVILSWAEENFLVLVDLLPARQVALSLFLGAGILSVADVAVRNEEKTKLAKILGPAGALGLASALGFVPPVNLFLGLSIMTGWMLLRWRVSVVTAVTPMAVTLVTLAEGELLRALLLVGYGGIAIWSYLRNIEREREEEGEEGEKRAVRKGGREKLEYPLVYKGVLSVFGAVLAFRWGLGVASKWQLI